MHYVYLGESGPLFHHNGMIAICSTLNNKALDYGLYVCKIGGVWDKKQARRIAGKTNRRIELDFYRHDGLWFLKVDNQPIKVNINLLTLITLIHIQNHAELDDWTAKRLSNHTLGYTEKVFDDGFEPELFPILYQQIQTQ